MPVANLAKIFGPTIIGYSCSEPDPEMALKQLKKQHSVKKKKKNAFKNFRVVSITRYFFNVNRLWKSFYVFRVIIGLAMWTSKPKLSRQLP